MEKIRTKKSEWFEFFSQIKWPAIVIVIFLHCGALYGLYLGVVSTKWQTIIFTYILAILSAIGTLAGSHRYYSHRSFKAKWPLRLILMLLQTLSGQRSIITWAQEHRTHHKYTGTDADCANINRGFFFAHIGWLLMITHPDCEKRMKDCDVSDLLSDPFVRFQDNYYIPLYLVINALLPTLLPHYLFDESLNNCFFGSFMFRYVYTLHVAFCGQSLLSFNNFLMGRVDPFAGNSVAHIWGTKPYDKGMTATENDSLIYATLGGAYHNYHHVFPYDYSASELGCNSNFNLMTALINIWSSMGLAYDLKRAPKYLIEKRKQRTGDITESKLHLRRHPVIDWVFGLVLSAVPLWIVIALRIFYQLFSIRKIIV